MTETVELKPCPFCGGSKAFSGPTLDDQFYAMCGDDNCSGMVGYFASEAEAVFAWNTRAALAVTVKPLEWKEDGAVTPFGKYRVVRTDDGYALTFDHDELVHIGFNAVEPFQSARQEAISRAQPDYEQRILTALELRTPPPEPASGWMLIEADTVTPAIVCAFGDPDRHWLPMTAYRAAGGKWERPASRDGLPYEPTHYLSLSDLPSPPAKEPQ